MAVDLDAQGVGDEAEETTGSFILLNNDDDNDNHADDLADANVIGEGDLVAVSLGLSPALASGSLILESATGGNRIKVWTQASKVTEVALPKTWDVGVDAIPGTLYVEGVALSDNPRDTQLRLRYTKDAFSHADLVCFTVLRIELEPVTIRPDNGVTFPLRNPCAVTQSRDTTFEIQVLPASIADNDIVWSRVNGGIQIKGQNRGRSVCVTGNTVGAAQAQVNIAGYLGPSPTIDMNVLTTATAQLHVYIVRQDDGTGGSWSEADFAAFLNQVNLVYEQAAMRFEVQGQIAFVDHSAWLDLHSANNYQDFRELCSQNSNTGGLEVYLVRTIEGANGLNWSPANAEAGCAIAATGNMRTMAHEFGHGCNLVDVYTTTTLDNSRMREAWLPEDWNNGAGNQYYEGSLTQGVLLQRLLMYGVQSQTKSDIPRGTIHGLDRRNSLGLLPVGLSSLNRNNPHHW